MENNGNRNALQEMFSNLKALPKNLWDSLIRHGKTISDRTRSQAVFSNLFLHIHSTRTHKRSLNPLYTIGLGIASVSFFIILAVTGILLMIYYKPSVAEAYNSIKDIHYVVSTGRFMRNIHRWAAHLMLISVMLHMARVFYTASYRKPREWNWFIGIGLLSLTFALSFTGYLLPWDQLAYWAMTIGVNIAASSREITDALGITSWFDIGGLTRDILLGSKNIGEESLLRFYFLHCIFLPIGILALIGVHFWRIRKDGGLSRPDEAKEEQEPTFHQGHPVFPRDPNKTYGLMAVIKGTSPNVDKGPENTVSSWPSLFYAEMAVLMVCIAIALALGILFDAPLKELANPNIPENPAKAPWYFLGLQEIVSYSAFAGGILIPTIVLIGLALVPYLDRERNNVGIWFTNKEGKKVAFQSVILATIVIVGLLAFTVKYGWIRQWYPDVPQISITFINPGTIYVLIFTLWSLWQVKRYNSTRIGAIAMFTTFLVAYIILTYFATYHRGPNWSFYWWHTMWPIH